MLSNLTKADDLAKPLASESLGLGALGFAGAYGASAMAQSASSQGAPVASASNPIKDIPKMAEVQAESFALDMAGVEAPEAGIGQFTSGTGLASAAAGGVTALYQHSGGLTESGTIGSNIKEQFEGKNVFNAQKGRIFGSRKLSKFAKGAGNFGFRSMKFAGSAAVGTAVAAATTGMISRSTKRLSKKVLNTGTPGSRLSNTNVMDSGGARRKRSQPTQSGVSRYAGRMQGTMDGSTVLALHKTGGRGAVLGG